MYIREATQDDNLPLQALQARCPQGTTLVVSIVNTPDFFARARAYASWKVFVACEDNRLLGSAACACRRCFHNGRPQLVGYEFQYFTSPDCRQRGVAQQLHQHLEAHLRRYGAASTSCVILEGNVASARLFESQGFRLYRAVVASCLLVQAPRDVASAGRIRPAGPEDLPRLASLLNETWRGYEGYEPTSAPALAGFVERTPGYALDSLLVLEEGGVIRACLGFLDWGQIMRITVEKALAGSLRPGDRLRQMLLTPVGFQTPRHLLPLLDVANNRALARGVQQLVWVGEPDHPVHEILAGFARVPIGVQLYRKPLQDDSGGGGLPVFVDGIDL